MSRNNGSQMPSPKKEEAKSLPAVGRDEDQNKPAEVPPSPFEKEKAPVDANSAPLVVEQPERKKVLVQAIRPGFFANERKFEGDKFYVFEDKVGSWMKKI